MKQDFLIGHEKVEEFLLTAFRHNQLNHAYLLVGPPSVGKTTLVKRVARYLLCQQGTACGQCDACRRQFPEQQMDVWWVQKASDKQDITIDQIRELQEFIKFSSMANKYRVVIIEDAHYLNTEASNALLKSLEEPAAKVIFFLLSSEPQRLLPTIKSRCFVLFLGFVSKTKITKLLHEQGVTAQPAEELASLSAGAPGIALELLAKPELVEQYLMQGRLLLSLLTGNGFKDMVQYLESEFKDSSRPEGGLRQKAFKLVSVWRTVSHDLLCAKLGLVDYIHYQKLLSEFDQVKRLSLKQLWLVGQLMQEAEKKLRANGHIRLTLEWLAYSVKQIDKIQLPVVF